jgi:hypothetical protein
MAFKEEAKSGIPVACDICGTDFVIGCDLEIRRNRLEEVSFHVSPNLERKLGLGGQYLGDEQAIYIEHACRDCRIGMQGAVVDWIGEQKQWVKEQAAKRAAGR